MRPVQRALALDGARAPIMLPPNTGFLVNREILNLNSLIAGAVKHAAPAPGGIILRMEELPQINAFAQQIQEAFNLLLRFVVEHKSTCGKMYCYVKGAPAGPSLLDQKSSTGAYLVEIHTNVQADTIGAAQHLLQQAAGLFAQNKIGLEHKAIPAGGMLFSLTLYGCTQTSENEPRQ